MAFKDPYFEQHRKSVIGGKVSSSAPVVSGGSGFSDPIFEQRRITVSQTKPTPAPKVTTAPKVQQQQGIKIGGIQIKTPDLTNIHLPNPIEGFKSWYASITAPKKQVAPNPQQVKQEPIKISPEQKKLNDKQLKQIQLPNGQTATVSAYFVPNTTLSAAKPQPKKKQNLFEVAGQWIDSLFGISPEERARIKLNDQKAIDMNAYALKKNFPDETKEFSLTDLTKPGGNPFRESPSEIASKRALEKAGIYRQLNNKEVTDLMFALSLPIAGIEVGAVKTLTALGKFTAVSTAFDLAFQKITGKEAVSELLPEGTPQPIKIAVDGLELLGKGILSHGLKPGKITDVFTKETINKYKLPEKFKLTSEQVKDIFATKKLTTPEQQRAFKDLGLSEKQIEQAMQGGVTIEIPSSNLVKLVDRPFWAKMKSALRISPVEGERVSPKAKITLPEPKVPEKMPVADTKPQLLLEAPKEVYVRGDNFIMTEGVNKEKVSVMKTINSYRDAVRKFNENPTPKTLEAFQKARTSLATMEEQGVISQSAPGKVIVAKETRSTQVVPYERTSAPGIPQTVKVGEPIGEGQTKVVGLSKGVEAKAIEKGLTKSLGDLPEYKTVNMKDQANKAADLLKNNPQEAIDIALGRKAPPAELLPESVFVAVENQALKTGDLALIKQLAKSQLTTEATAMGQRIRTLGERNPDSPVSMIRDVTESRQKAIEKRLGKTVTEATQKITTDIKKKIKTPDKYDWGNFIKSIEC